MIVYLVVIITQYESGEHYIFETKKKAIDFAAIKANKLYKSYDIIKDDAIPVQGKDRGLILCFYNSAENKIYVERHEVR